MKNLFLLPIFLFAGASYSYTDDQTDSLNFELKRRQILAQNPDERGTLILGAAMDLAREGYHTEALDLIADMTDTSAAHNLTEDFLSESLTLPLDLHTESSTPVSKPWPISGYVETSGQYNEYELETHPWSARAKAKMDWRPMQSALDRMTAVFQGSDQNAYFDFLQKATFFNRMLKLEMEEQVEKKVNQTYGDSLDRAYFDIWAEANTRSLGKALSVSLPGRITVDQYRHTRFGFNSTRRIWAQPRLEVISEDLRRSFILSWGVQQSIYPQSRTSNNLRQGPTVWGEWYGDRVNLDIATQYQFTDYARDTTLYLQKDLEARAGIFVRTWPWLKVGLRAFGQSGVDHYRDRDSTELTNLTTVQAAYKLKGSLWTLEPQWVATWNSIYTATLSLAYSKTEYPIVTQVAGGELPIPRYLSNPSIDWNPSLGLTIMAKSIFWTMEVDYEDNAVKNPELYGVASTRGIGFDSQLNWKFGPGLEIDFSCNLERELTDTVLPGRIQDMTSISLGLTKRFP